MVLHRPVEPAHLIVMWDFRMVAVPGHTPVIPTGSNLAANGGNQRRFSLDAALIGCISTSCQVRTPNRPSRRPYPYVSSQRNGAWNQLANCSGFETSFLSRATYHDFIAGSRLFHIPGC